MMKVGRRAAIVLPFVMVLVGMVLLVGLSGAFQVSSARQTLERIYADRLVDLAADSAFEEASARLEAMNQQIPFPQVTDLSKPRNLKTTLRWVDDVAPATTQGSIGRHGVTLSNVRLRSSDWLFSHQAHLGQKYILFQETGILELAVDVSVAVGSLKLRMTVTCRRYMDASVDETGGTLKLHVLPRNMVYLVEGR